MNILEALSDNISVDKEKCIFCGRCTEACVADNIRLKVSPCRQNCPLGLNCQGYIQLIKRGELDKALAVIYETTPFAGTLGRICHHPCESACSRREGGDALAIRELKRYLADVATPPAVETPKKSRCERVAVIGGGPAGLAAAYDLLRTGLDVKIFEAGSRLGGMMASHIPEFRLPVAVLLREARRIEAMGAKVSYNTKVGTDISYGQILADFDYVVVATGMPLSRKLGIAGEDAANVFDALAVLDAAKHGDNVNLGERVVVIGGGNTAINAAQVALRLGAKSVKVLSLECRGEIPAFESEVAEALYEGAVLDYGWGPAAFGVEDGRVRRVGLRRCVSVFDNKRCFDPVFAPGETMSLDVDSVIVAIGQRADVAFSELATAAGAVVADPVTFATSTPNVYAAGDVVTGPKSVVAAMAQGREAATSIIREVLGLPVDYERDRYSGAEREFAVDTPTAEAPRAICAKAGRGERLAGAEIEACYTGEAANFEASRCLSCGEPYGKFRNCWSCLACEVECPEKALSVDIPYLLK